MIEALATLLSVLGSIFVVRKSRWGHAIWIVANLLWMYVGAVASLWGMVACMVFYTVISMYGFVSWSADEGSEWSKIKLILFT